MTTPLTFTSYVRADGVSVLVATGEVDLSNSADFAAATDAALAGAAGRLLVDLRGVEYLDSAGLNELLIRAGRLEIVAGTLLAPLLTISGITELTTVYGLTGGGPTGVVAPWAAEPPA
ncbi:STAS domain-containing protein [Actinacidiphila epipremni]|jgi:anti-anti-sigma factor|uniref:STAS domain-containing protein n=1 Tax=Actinacidiphila epipremni TaxID=2053013 RepID=A0ABX0ZYT9_9ACTN|nr:STAS domain-containing protein [Actinacidiphila epipremni]NJP48120.1 STAS domain-containing protein [Actinacidiphila epipremni]